jgi:TetR/AcrR family transcriptional regulator, cholesterol catabolism regulator
MAHAPSRPALRLKYDAKLRDLVDTAASLFAEQGYHATSIENLLSASGLTRGGLYHYIDGKHDLLIAVQRELLEPLLDRARAAIEETDDPETQLRSVTRIWVEHVETHRDHMVVFNAERRTVESDPRWAEVVAARNEFEGLLAGIFARGEQAGLFAVEDGSLARLALLGMVNHMPSWYRPGGRLNAAEVADRFCDVLLNGISTR